MKLALDPQMFYSSSSVSSCPTSWPLGYDWMELSPKADFVRSSSTRESTMRASRLKKIGI